MPMLSTDSGVQLHYTDSGGSGRPVVLIHGWPLSGESFAPNLTALIATGHRVITYDRRGFGQSDKPEDGYNYDTLAADLNELLTQLDLQEAVLLGFSMGGGEVARYVGTYGTQRLAGVAFSGSICPALCVNQDNPDGAMKLEEFQQMAKSCQEDPQAFLDQFITSFYSTDQGLTVAQDVRQRALQIALQSDTKAASESIMAWAEDFRDDCRAIDLPALAIHGDGDLNVPLTKSSARLPEYVSNCSLVVIEGAPHGANVSHQGEWERALLDFLSGLA